MNSSSLIVLRDRMVAYFADLVTFSLIDPAIVPAVKLGHKERTKQINQGAGQANRIVIMPGDPNGTGGELGAPYKAKDNPRTILEWTKLVTLSIWAADKTALSVEANQIAAVEDLFEWAARAVQASVPGDVMWKTADWVLEPEELRYGMELLVVLELRGPLFDLEIETRTPAVGTITKVLSHTAG